jgi:hypothetical protein
MGFSSRSASTAADLLVEHGLELLERFHQVRDRPRVAGAARASATRARECVAEERIAHDDLLVPSVDPLSDT